MHQYVAILLAALIGAIIGSIGAVIVEFWLSRRAKEKQSKKQIAQKYLFQMQDATESLWYRLDNLAVFHREIQENSYFESTTLYVIGRVLASERILGIDGVYPLLIDLYPKLINIFRTKIDKTLGKIGLKQYDRISLAESIIEVDNGKFRLSTFLEFKKKYERHEKQDHQLFEPARKAIRSLGDEAIRNSVSDFMKEVAMEISEHIKVPSSIPK